VQRSQSNIGKKDKALALSVIKVRSRADRPKLDCSCIADETLNYKHFYACVEKTLALSLSSVLEANGARRISV
jgi:hypothetical protein